MSPAPISVGWPPAGVTVIRPDRICTNSCVSSVQWDGPGVHSQTPASWSPSFHRVRPLVVISLPVASSSGPQSSSSAVAAAARYGVAGLVSAIGAFLSWTDRRSDRRSRLRGLRLRRERLSLGRLLRKWQRDRIGGEAAVAVLIK